MRGVSAQETPVSPTAQTFSHLGGTYLTARGGGYGRVMPGVAGVTHGHPFISRPPASRPGPRSLCPAATHSFSPPGRCCRWMKQLYLPARSGGSLPRGPGHHAWHREHQRRWQGRGGGGWHCLHEKRTPAWMPVSPHVAPLDGGPSACGCSGGGAAGSGRRVAC